MDIFDAVTRAKQLQAGGATIVFAGLHPRKASQDLSLPIELLVNPGLSPEGEVAAWKLVDLALMFGPFDVLCSSMLRRALDLASVASPVIGVEKIETHRGLGMWSNLVRARTREERDLLCLSRRDEDFDDEKGEDVEVVYPGHEGENFVYWASMCEAAFRDIGVLHSGKRVFVAGHRPTVLGLIALLLGMTDSAAIEAVVKDQMMAKNGFHIFAIHPGGQIEHLSIE